jgi:hypothetical protein
VNNLAGSADESGTQVLDILEEIRTDIVHCFFEHQRYLIRHSPHCSLKMAANRGSDWRPSSQNDNLSPI